MTVESPIPQTEPPRDCPLCPRLVALRQALRVEHPDWWNGPVRSFGDPNARIAIVGLAPGKQGANRTGRPFTGDFAGDLLFDTLSKFGLSNGRYQQSLYDGLALNDLIIINAVKCLPPENKPTPLEIATCRRFLAQSVAALPTVRIFVALGRIAHDSALKLLGGRPGAMRFGHLAEHVLPDGRILLDSYHCSRRNQNTGRLSREAFEAVFARAVALRDQSDQK